MTQNQLTNAIRDYLPLRTKVFKDKTNQDEPNAFRVLEKVAHSRQLTKPQLIMAMAQVISGGYRK